jgi:hypothetical protein
MKKTMALTTLIAVLCGCSTTSSDLNNLSLGMEKQDVIRILGTPQSTAAKGDTEVLRYWLKRAEGGGKDQYIVQIVDGKVAAFGTKADLGTGLLPTGRPAPAATN